MKIIERRLRRAAYTLAAAAVLPAHAEETTPAPPPVLGSVNVIGQSGDVSRMPGSAHYISQEDIRDKSYDDVDQVLRRVPGTYARGEDGYGLFPNISLRGVDTGRSAKVTIMEDGILSAPAPYAAPSAYYSPTTGRMSGIEILKGSSQVKYGPHTTGGVINYLSTPIPTAGRAYLRGLYGEDNEFRIHGNVGNTLDTAAGRFGYLLEGYFRTTDGFKSIDETADFRDGSETGFTNVEPMVKLSFEPRTAVYQRLEFKFGYTDRDADETYLGLSEADFRDDPTRRYAASRFDNIATEQYRSYLRYFISPTDDLDLVTTVYYNDFARNWYKLHDLRNVPGVAGTVSLSRALAGDNGGAGLACLEGQLGCTLNVRNNNREYYSAGVEQQAVVRFESGAVQHEVTAGVRYHYDEEDRFQSDDRYAQAGNGTITGVTLGIPGTGDNRVESVDALAFFVQDRIRIGKWQLTPGIRFETLDLERVDRDRVTPSKRAVLKQETSVDMLGGGLGVVYDWNDQWKLFGGIHRGFSPPPPGGAVNDDLEEETSVAYELGARYSSANGAFMAEAVGFLTQFDDLLVTPNFGATGDPDASEQNIGEVDSLGAELSASFDAGLHNGWLFSNPWFMTFTYTDAELKSDTGTTDEESIFSFGRKGNKVPYIPEHQLTLGTGLHFERWGGELSASYIDETFTSASNVSTQVDGNGNPNSRFGKTDDYWVVDLSGYYELRQGTKVFAGVHNLLDDEYIVSRQPHGPRPGQPRFAYVGMEFDLDL